MRRVPRQGARSDEQRDAAAAGNEPGDAAQREREQPQEDDARRQHRDGRGREHEGVGLRLSEERLLEELVLLPQPPEDQRGDHHERHVQVVTQEQRGAARARRLALEADHRPPRRLPGRDHEGEEGDQRARAGEAEREP